MMNSNVWNVFGSAHMTVELELFGKMCFELLMLHEGTGTAPSGVFQGPRPHLAITSGTSSQAVPRCLYLLSGN
ncbi:hypothetical protein JOQ06_017925 [Pogonophryne albipinna]|uniref:Uncharacterized protein n=1 Tax=Pogonophryne albipinna TaxID=1090488 RepID=A0AAD6AGZ5_9TELE|nr:hypothetical protein JOQ06_017925 [Pogonophryne albipinna]